MFHQKHNSIGGDIYSGYLYLGHHWPLHMHKSLEFVYVMQGRVQATVGQTPYLLEAGQTLFVMPYQPHAYVCGEGAVYFIACFSQNHIPGFVAEHEGFEPSCSRILLPEETARYLLSIHGITATPAPDGKTHHLCPTPSLYARKAALYAICAQIETQTQWRPQSRDSELTDRILSYIENNYTEDISLQSLAESLSYEYHYLSRILHNTLGVSFTTLVNQYRCDRAERLLRETRAPISEIALSCGFQSIRSFNRLFAAHAGRSPSALRAGRTEDA